ncbi:MAG TPA: hypothetical protein VM864_04330 [Pyrinomonadaceae bacterium]|jgi:hypothetical protein|nr:hypothetical protein [Pyrinomonadaceae bacterium]
MNPLSRLARPRLPSSAVGLTGSSASVVSLDRRRDAFVVKRAGISPLPEGLLRPGFDESNVADVGELARVLAGLAESTGLARKRRWSVALPEAAARTAILTLESASASRAETEEMLRWKIERTFGAGADELRVSRHRLRGDSQGRARFLATAARASVLSEYEAVCDALGWRAGLLLPSHMGEEQWLMRGVRDAADSLLVSSHGEGFTAALLRDNQPLLVRSVTCDPEDRADELYRFLLFYRDRLNSSNDDGSSVVGRMLVAGQGIGEEQALAIVEETLSARPRLLRAEEARLSLPSHELPFAQLAAPAGLAALAFG